MNSKIDIKYVYLNEKFEILDGNREFYVYFDLVGHDILRLSDFTGASSLEPLKKFILKKKNPENFKIFKFKKNQQSLKPNIVTSYDSLYKGQKAVCLKMIDVEQCIKFIKKHNSETDELVYALSIANDCLFSYHENDNYIKITQFYNNKKNVLYECDIDEWKQYCLEQKFIPENQENAFFDFIDELKNCPKEIKANFYSSIRTNNSEILENLCFTGERLVDNGEISVVGRIILMENSEKYQQQKNIIEQLHTDPLTKIFNKETVTTYAKRIFEEQREDNIALVIMDLDHFKPVNDTFGHLAGDRVLAKTGEILKEIVGSRGIVGRYGGDEFLIVSYGMKNEMILRGFLHSILSKIQNEFAGQFGDIYITCSVGCSVFPKNGTTFDELFKKADFGLYRAKDKGRNRYVFFRDDLHADLYRQALQANDIVKYADREVQELKYMSEFLQDIATAPKEAVERILTHIKEVFKLDNISIFSGEELSLVYSLGKKMSKHQNALYAKTKNFKEFLDGKSYIVSNFVGNPYLNEENFRREMEQAGIKSTLQCVLGTPSDIRGLVTFNHTKNAQLWADYEINCALMFASTLNLLYNNTASKN
ncbi:GGDEF domain-containing protein [Treponema berlinense]|uniref:GGDEF domain-containing protein n=1 Tax=Treponema berlinense TaxID=225004 RepID=UPI0026E98846|nr:GGDEF domain-containing protein [Treponema berlinense]